MKISNRRDVENLLLDNVVSFVTGLTGIEAKGDHHSKDKPNDKGQDEKLHRKTMVVNGNKIEGSWKDNRLHGFTTIEYLTG